MVRTNWKYILILILLVTCVSIGILVYQYFWLSQKKIEPIEVKKEKIIPPSQKDEFIEVSLDELREGENKIGGITVEKIFSKNKFLGINEDSLTQFIYQNNTYRIEPLFIPLEEAPATHMDTEYEIKIIKNGIEKRITNFTGHGRYIFWGQGEWIYGVTYTWGHIGANLGTYGLELFSFNKEGEVERKVFMAKNIVYSYSQEMLPDISSLIEKKGKLYIKVKNGYCYFEVKNVKGSVFNNPIACVYEYYLLDNGKVVKSNLEFKGEYLKEVNKYNEILQEATWKGNDWLSPLLGKTLNLIFAEEEEKAWKEFFEDFVKFSKKYPFEEIEKINPNKIKEEIEKELKER